MGRRKKLILGAAALPVLLLLLTVAAWAIDTGAASGRVLRNVELAGSDIGGLGRDGLLERVAALNAAIGDRGIRIETPEVTYQTTAAEIGLAVDVVSTTDAALDHGRTALLPTRPLGWLVSFLRPRQAAIHYVVDVETARATLRRLEGDALVSPVEPTIASDDGAPFEPEPGAPGTGINPDTLATALAAAAEDTPFSDDVTVSIQQSTLAPRLADDVAERAADVANEATETTLRVEVDDLAALDLGPDDLRRVMRVREAEATVEIEIDPERLLPTLQAGFADIETAPVDASFTVVDGTVSIIPAVPGRSCCSLDAVERIQRAFDRGDDSVSIDLVETQPDFTTEDAQALGIVEEIGSPTAFGPTTRHQCCQNRVTNIHRIADIIRGAVIEPGATFSINGYVGKRTVEDGFVVDGVIYNGVHSEDVGGGVSQFATTLFNAALYAGLEFGDYQSHSLYISRYPKGHEATISWPEPDLEIVNQTPYGVLIWPEYTNTSLTVRLFSTRYIGVTVGDPTPRPQGNCTRWTTPRTRTYPDGSSSQDSVFALYRPEEGVVC